MIFSPYSTVLIHWSISRTRAAEQAFELMKAKFKDNPQIMGYVDMFEKRFDESVKK